MKRANSGTAPSAKHALERGEIGLDGVGERSGSVDERVGGEGERVSQDAAEAGRGAAAFGVDGSGTETGGGGGGGDTYGGVA